MVSGIEPGGRDALARRRRRPEIPVDSPEELAALAAVLREPKVFLYDDGLVAARWDEIHKG